MDRRSCSSGASVLWVGDPVCEEGGFDAHPKESKQFHGLRMTLSNIDNVTIVTSMIIKG